MERMPPEYEARLRLNDPTLAFVATEDGGLTLVEVLDPVTYPRGHAHRCWYDFTVRVRHLGVHLPEDMRAHYVHVPWIEREFAVWVEDEP